MDMGDRSIRERDGGDGEGHENDEERDQEGVHSMHTDNKGLMERRHTKLRRS
jgi:hypothetical protein